MLATTSSLTASSSFLPRSNRSSVIRSRHQEDRLRMLELMAEGDARFEVDAIEVERVAYLSRWTRSQSMRDGSRF